MALVSLVAADHQFFKSCIGVPGPWASRREPSLSHSFRQHVVVSGEPLIIADARQHPVVHDNPALAALGGVAYAGIPLITVDGYLLGSFCVIDNEPGTWRTREIDILRDLADGVMTEIEVRAAARALEHERGELERRVYPRTAALNAANVQLRSELVGANAQRRRCGRVRSTSAACSRRRRSVCIGQRLMGGSWSRIPCLHTI